MKNQANLIKDYLLKQIPNHPNDIVAAAAKKFNVSRTTIHRHLNRLLTDNSIIVTGKTKRAAYYLKGSLNKTLTFKIQNHPDEYDCYIRYFADNFSGFNKNIKDICEYGFTEIFNNAIDHSSGTKVVIKTKWDNNNIIIIIKDDGIGIFKKIKNAFKLTDSRESVLQLTKGKITTDPDKHTGEGIFFTSQAFDKFTLIANKIYFCRDNIINDWYLQSLSSHNVGTEVKMQINKNSTHELMNLFQKYQNPKTLAFDRTQIIVELSRLEHERFISRSQAKRILFGLDKFNYIVLDFKGVTTVGQAFVDEVFRVFKNKHPNIEIKYINANQDVEFMIKRGLATHLISG